MSSEVGLYLVLSNTSVKVFSAPKGEGGGLRTPLPPCSAAYMVETENDKNQELKILLPRFLFLQFFPFRVLLAPVAVNSSK